jgi:ATP-binding cassette subfamily F protein 3
MKRLAKLAGTEAVRAERSLHITLPEPLKLPNSLLSLHHVEAGDRVALLGPNGAGKSTLVKSLVGELPLLSGERGGHPDLRIGYFAQHTVESLREGTTAIDHLADIAPGVATQQLRDFLGKWNFPGDRAFEKVDVFSGGERARLALALIAWRKPNVLLLDEPTNHLDLDMREALAEALSIFEGAIVMVSHDRHLIGLVCDTFWRVADGVAQPFDGDLDAYAVWLRTRDSSNDGKVPAKVAAAAPAPAPAAKPAAKATKANAHKLAQAEAHVAELESKLHTLDMDLADPDQYAGGGTDAAELAKRREQVAAELAKAEEALLGLYEGA